MGKPTTISVTVDPDLLAEARGEGIDFVELVERALLRQLSTPTAVRMKSERAEAWRTENAEAIRAWNDEVERNGMWSDGFRQF
jgi:post-segregation antitoxin (ccd killing protein)